MAEISRGSVSTLPGHHAQLPEGTMCDDHPDRPAVARVQGETDSFGCEYNDLCQECLDEHRADVLAEKDREECCDWCKTMSRGLSNRRDYEEGMGGPVYRVCRDCIVKENKRLDEEESYYDDYRDSLFDDGGWND